MHEIGRRPGERRARWLPGAERTRPQHASGTPPEAAAAPSRVEQGCLDKGLKMTGQRRVIAQVLSDSGDYPTVEDVYQRARVLDPCISVATVYRTVRLLEEKGIVQRRAFDSGRARYEASSDPNGRHIVEVDTGHVSEFRDPALEPFLREGLARLGYELVACHLQLFARKLPAARGRGAAPRPRR